MRVFLDACIIIYWVEAAHPFYTTLISTLQTIAEQHPENTLTVSRLSLLECLVKPLRDKDKTILRVYQQFFESPELTIIEIDHKVINIATQLRVDHTIRTPDAIQAACCLSINEQHLFLTNDKKLSGISKLNVVQL